MTEPTNSLTAHVAPLEAGEHVAAAAFLGDEPALALAGGVIKIGGRDVVAHPEGAILCATLDGDRLITGGDDGRGLAFLPRGYRLACAHYNGVSLWFPNADATPQVMEWKGSHLDATVSPDGRFLVTSMQENALHGWRLSDGRNMRMTGYPAKTRSLSWSHDGHWLATSGAEACVVWPFKEKDGPMGKPPRECGVRPLRVTQVACHPRALVVAIGYADGLVLLCRLGDGAEILVRDAAPDDGAISALAWDKQGARLVFGTEAGHAGLLTLPA
jgi:WD40 repeat protein